MYDYFKIEKFGNSAGSTRRVELQMIGTKEIPEKKHLMIRAY